MQEASKFKVGDSVRIIASNHGAPKSTIGEIGIIVRADGNYKVEFADIHEKMYTWSYIEEELEAVEPVKPVKPKTNLGDLLKAALDKPKSTDSNSGELVDKPKETSGELVVNAEGGIKADGGKIDYTYLLKDLPVSVAEVTKVLEYGAKKYNRSNYSKVESERYEGAFLRHAMSYLKGEKLDPETGHHHLAHAVCCLLFLIEREVK